MVRLAAWASSASRRGKALGNVVESRWKASARCRAPCTCDDRGALIEARVAARADVARDNWGFDIEATGAAL